MICHEVIPSVSEKYMRYGTDGSVPCSCAPVRRETFQRNPCGNGIGKVLTEGNACFCSLHCERLIVFYGGRASDGSVELEVSLHERLTMIV